MIRRNAIGPDGQPRWILISQVDHAQVSGRLAQVWRDFDVLASPDREEIVGAIYHHDDGWQQWERRIEVDRRSGRPLQFIEMPLTETIDIWTRSIELAREIGPLAAFIVAGHFVHLMRTSSAWHADPAGEGALARHWVAEFQSRQIDWLADWQATGRPVGHAAEGRTSKRTAEQKSERVIERMSERPAEKVANAYEFAERAVQVLQFFDVLSLWFCCAERTIPAEFTLPDGSIVTLAPSSHTSTGSSGPEPITMSPWLLAEDTLELTVPGRSVPAEEYADATALAAAASEEVTLTWRLKPS